MVKIILIGIIITIIAIILAVYLLMNLILAKLWSRSKPMEAFWWQTVANNSDNKQRIKWQCVVIKKQLDTWEQSFTQNCLQSLCQIKLLALSAKSSSLFEFNQLYHCQRLHPKFKISAGIKSINFDLIKIFNIVRQWLVFKKTVTA